MSSALQTSTNLAGPGVSTYPRLYSIRASSSIDAGRRTRTIKYLTPVLEVEEVEEHTERKHPKRVRVTAVVGSTPESPAYEVNEVDSDSDASETGRTPSAPRIPFPPSPIERRWSFMYDRAHARLPRDVGLGFNMNMGEYGMGETMSTITYPADGDDSPVFYPLFQGIGLGCTLDDEPLRFESGSSIDDDSLVESEDDKEAYYHLPSNLLSPEFVMSAEEFKDSLRMWMERRMVAPQPEKHSESEAGVDNDEIEEEIDSEQDLRRKSV